MRFINNMIQSDKNNARADKLNVKAFNKIVTSEKELSDCERKTRASIEKLSNRKRGVLSTSFPKFLEVYEKMMKINFTEGDGINELNSLSIGSVAVSEVKEMVSIASKELTTGQILSTMIVRGGISGVIRQESEMSVSEARIRSSQASLIESQIKTNCVILESIYQRAERISKLIAQLNVLFIKSLVTTREIIDKKGIERKNYTQKDRDSLAMCINIVSTLKIIIDTPLLNQNGELEEQSISAIEIGNDYINKITKLI